MEYWFWLLVIAGGPLLLLVAFSYATLKRRRLSVEEKVAQHEAVDEIYHPERHEGDRVQADASTPARPTERTH